MLKLLPMVDALRESGSKIWAFRAASVCDAIVVTWSDIPNDPVPWIANLSTSYSDNHFIGWLSVPYVYAPNAYRVADSSNDIFRKGWEMRRQLGQLPKGCI
jgi:hypothetical protein